MVHTSVSNDQDAPFLVIVSCMHTTNEYSLAGMDSQLLSDGPGCTASIASPGQGKCDNHVIQYDGCIRDCSTARTP